MYSDKQEYGKEIINIEVIIIGKMKKRNGRLKLNTSKFCLKY